LKNKFQALRITAFIIEIIFGPCFQCSVFLSLSHAIFSLVSAAEKAGDVTYLYDISTVHQSAYLLQKQCVIEIWLIYRKLNKRNCTQGVKHNNWWSRKIVSSISREPRVISADD